MSIGLLIKDNLRQWLRARGYLLILVAALVPPLLTGAWVATHQNDVHAAEITHDGDELRDDERINITATIRNAFDERVGAFNATIRVGFFDEVAGSGLRFTTRASEEFQIDGLAAHASTTVQMEWTAEPGTFIFQLLVDTDDAIQEIEERNNDVHIQVQVGFEPLRFQAPPSSGEPEEGVPDVDIEVVEVTWEPGEVYHRDRANVTVRVRNPTDETIENATVRMQVHQRLATGYSQIPNPNLDERIRLGPGEERGVTFPWTPSQIGQYAIVGSVDPSPGARDTNVSDNLVVQETFIDRRELYEAPEEKATAKDFYRDVLSLLHLRLLIPLIALFYAGSVLEDERERGHLPYILSRPLPRWMIPLARFITTVLVAGAALIVGVIATMLVLLGTPGDAPGFLYWPVAFTLVALMVYSAVFTLVGVTSRRPYLWGLAYVIGFEAVILIGQQILINGRPLLPDVLPRASLNYWIQRAFAGWDPSLGMQWVPATDNAWRALWVILAIAAASLAGAAWWMQRREFEE